MATKSKNTKAKIPAGYEPISMWGYFGYQILFALPIIGLVALIIYSFINTSNVNRTNFARSFFCIWIISLVLAAIMISAGLSLSILEGITNLK